MNVIHDVSLGKSTSINGIHPVSKFADPVDCAESYRKLLAQQITCVECAVGQYLVDTQYLRLVLVDDAGVRGLML